MRCLDPQFRTTKPVSVKKIVTFFENVGCIERTRRTWSAEDQNATARASDVSEVSLRQIDWGPTEPKPFVRTIGWIDFKEFEGLFCVFCIILGLLHASKSC